MVGLWLGVGVMVGLVFALLVRRVNDLSVRLSELERRVSEIQRKLDYVVRRLNELEGKV